MPRGGGTSAGSARSYLVGSVANALVLLSAFREHPSLAVKEAAGLLGVVPSTAHRLLTTLRASGYVTQDQVTRRYGPGPELLGVAIASLERVDVRRVARPHLVALAAETGETASLAVAEGAMVRFIDSVEGPSVVRVSSRAGEVLPAHLSAAGKVLLSALSRASLLRLFPSTRLAGRTPGSVMSRRDLQTELEAVRSRGYAVSSEGSAPGLTAVAVPVRDPLGHVLAAIAVSVPAERLVGSRTSTVAASARLRAQRIEEALGGLTGVQVAPLA